MKLIRSIINQKNVFTCITLSEIQILVINYIIQVFTTAVAIFVFNLNVDKTVG